MNHGIDPDTMAAIATPPGEGGLAVIRISGPRALELADRVFRGLGPPPSRRPASSFAVGRIMRADEMLDEAICLVMRAPHSYTGEDTAEIQVHGGSVNARRVLRCVLDAGARLADPGEFTRRAFLNGRMDLVQAEAVADLIHARSERAARVASEQLHGSLSRLFNNIYNVVLRATAEVEAALDFPDDELPSDVLGGVGAGVSASIVEIERLIQTGDEGHVLRDGLLSVIAGRPNVGKSTLLNALLGRDRAIVSPHPGTTRDTIEEGFVLDGYPVRLVDTAGLRPTECEIERDGIRRTKAHMDLADVTLFTVDGSKGLSADEAEELARLPPERTLVVANKSDLGAVPLALPAGVAAVRTALITGAGLEDLKRAWTEILHRFVSRSAGPVAAISERHRQLLDRAAESLRQAQALISGSREDAWPLAAAHMKDALESLGLITGRVYHQELLDSIFSRFCIGK